MICGLSGDEDCMNIFTVRSPGQFFYKQNQYDQALLACDSAFHSLIPNYDIDKDLPNQAEIKRNIAPNILHKVLELKIDIFGRTYVNQPKEETLKKALSGVGTLEIISQEMRIGKPEQHQFAWATILSTSYEKALSICYHAYKTTGDVQYMNQAFQIMEKNKSLLLLQAYQNTAAKKISQIPAEVLQQEKDLLYEQANLKQAIYESKNLQIKDSLNQLLVKQGVTYNNFVKQLEQNYPSYYELKYSLSITDLTTLQKSLAKDQIALSYFIGQEDSYVIQISKAKTYFKALPNVKKDSISAKIHKMRAAIYDFALNSAKHSNFRKDITVYTELSHQLYQDLVGNILEPENGKNRILLITSGILDYLPFGTLLTAPPTKIGQFKTYPYWIRDYAISYTQSATLWQQMQAAKAKHKTKANQLFLGFAPSFDPKAEASSNNHQIFAPLINNKEEVKDIFEMLSNRGQKILGNEASESNFKKLASAYRILHFATHGKFNRKDANYSKLAFSPVDSVEDGILYLHEIYNVELNADLVVLSACETGLGQLQQGEGIVSLARGFSFAGAKSLITTLWSVNDKSTSVFMITFYKYLKQGFPKDVALQKAQLYLIENSAAGQDISTSHPFFWSPYILIGDNNPMNLSDVSYTIWWYILGILGVLGIFGFWYFRR